MLANSQPALAQSAIKPHGCKSKKEALKLTKEQRAEQNRTNTENREKMKNKVTKWLKETCKKAEDMADRYNKTEC
ncbi:hypothetical protein PM082_013564 [Marasmius tenuissimus]|nr:hypothetical protein PM082_013564 [Marasmius tenuissimus]